MWYQLKGFSNYECNKEGKVRTRNTHRVLKGYMRHKKHCITLTRYGKSKHYPIAKEIYKTLVGKIPKGYEVAHLNGNPKDHSINNLKLMTPNEIAKHLGYTTKNNIPCEYVDEGGSVEWFKSYNEAAKQMNVSPAYVRSVVNGEVKNPYLNFRRAK